MNKKNIGIFIGVFSTYIFMDAILLLGMSLVGIDYKKFSTNQLLIVDIISSLLITICFYFIYRKYLQEKFKDFKNNFGKYLDIGLKYWGIGLIIMMISNYLISVLTPVSEAINESSVQELIKTSPVLALLLTTIFAPIIEEIIFRKGIQDIFKKKEVFIIISGLIFGLMHVISSTNLYEALYIIPYASLGISLAMILSKTDNIYTTIIIHMIHNGILTIISILL